MQPDESPATPEQELDAMADDYARQSHALFCERVLKNPETGGYCEMADVHALASEHVEEAWAGGYFAGVVMPWDHGKTMTGVVGRTLYELGRNPNLRVKIICNADEMAKQRVQAIGDYISGDEDFQRVFPGCRPSVSETRGATQRWTSSRLLLERDVPSPDQSLEAWGILSSGMGGRADVLLFDDPVDHKNAIVNPGMRTTVKEVYKNVWLSRLVPSGKVAYFATVWHEDDLTREQMRNPRFFWLVVRVSEDASCLECERFVGGSQEVQRFTLPLWERYNKARLLLRRQELGERAYNRGFRQIPISDADRTFPKFPMAIVHGRRVDDLCRPSWPCIFGVDLAGKHRKGTVIFVGRVDPASLVKVPIAILDGKWSGSEKLRMLQAAYERFRPIGIFVENNAQQQDLIDVCMDDPKFSFADPAILHGHLTGDQKFDPVIGLPSMDVEFERGAAPRGWQVPGLEFTGPGHDAEECGPCGWCRWVEEMNMHPFGKQTDAVMAAWIFREGVRTLYGSGVGIVSVEDIQAHGAMRRDEDGLPDIRHGRVPDGLTGALKW